MQEEAGNSYTELQSRAQTLLDLLSGILSGDWLGLDGLFPPIDGQLPGQPMLGEPQLDPETGLPIQGESNDSQIDPETGELLPNVAQSSAGLAQLQSQFSELSGKMTTLQGNIASVQSQVSNAATKAILAENKASQAMGTAMRALSKAGSCSCKPANPAEADSDAGTPDYVKGPR